MTSSLVVLTDFYAVTNRALSYAAALALPLRAHLVLLHVRHSQLLAPDEYSGTYPGWAERRTARALGQLAGQQGVPTEVAISEEFLPDAVQEAVRRHHPLLVVMGRSGADTVPAEVLTSTAMDVLRHAAHPLLVVPAPGWDAFPPRRLLLAVDGEPFSLGEHQDVVGRLLFATGATLDVVHVSDDEHARPTTTERVLDTVRANDLVDELSISQLHEVYHPTVVGGVLEEAARQQADMLVVVARRHSLLGGLFHDSMTARILRESPIPVLVLPAED